MNFFRTMLLLAALTALFMGVGYMIGGTGGMLIALLFAIGTNAFAFWNSDKMVLRMHGAEPVTRASAPELYDMVATLAKQADLPMPKVFMIRSDQPNAFATGRNPENAAVAATTGILQAAEPRGAGRRDGARAGPHQEPRHADDDHRRDRRRRDLDAGAVRLPVRWVAATASATRWAARGDPGGDLRADGGDDDPDGDQPHPRVLRRPARRARSRAIRWGSPSALRKISGCGQAGS